MNTCSCMSVCAQPLCMVFIMKKNILLALGVLAFCAAIILAVVLTPATAPNGPSTPVDDLPPLATYQGIQVVPSEVGEAVVLTLDNAEDVDRVAGLIDVRYLPAMRVANIIIRELDLDMSEDPYTRRAEKITVSEELANIEKFEEVMYYSSGSLYLAAFKEDVKHHIVTDKEAKTITITFEKNGIYEEETVYTVRGLSKSFESVHLDILDLLSVSESQPYVAYDENFEFYAISGVYATSEEARVALNLAADTAIYTYVVEPVSTGNRGKTMK